MGLVLLICLVVAGASVGLFVLMDRRMRRADVDSIKNRLLGTAAKKAQQAAAPSLMGGMPPPTIRWS